MKYDIHIGASNHNWLDTCLSKSCIINLYPPDLRMQNIMIFIRCPGKYLDQLYNKSKSSDLESRARVMLSCTLGQDLVQQISFLYPFINDDQIYANEDAFFLGSPHSYSQMLIYVPLSKINVLPDEISEFILMNLDRLT